jgi:hypothetical protein
MLLLGLALAVAMGGCTASRLPDYPTMPVAEYGPHKTADGVTVAIHPITSATEARKYFGMNPLKSNILPVLVVVENKHAQDNYIIRKERIGLAGPQEAPDRGAVGSSGGANAVGVAAGVAIVAAPIAAPALLVTFAAMKSQADEIKRNFATKELQQETIAPGTTKGGFVYLQLPPGTERGGRGVMHVELWEPVSKTPRSFDFDIRLTGE